MEKCPACGHVKMHSIGRLRKPTLLERLFRKATPWIWRCEVGYGSNWTVSACGCQHEFHQLLNSSERV